MRIAEGGANQFSVMSNVLMAINQTNLLNLPMIPNTELANEVLMKKRKKKEKKALT